MRHAKTTNLIEMAAAILDEGHPMTVRQVYYQLISRQVLKNCRASYAKVSNALVAARQEGIIPWEHIEDRNRRPRSVSMWPDLPSFADTCRRAYRRDVWATQPNYIEVWLEKDALSGIFEEELRPYGVTLNVGRGYDGWDSIYNAACRFNNADGDVAVLYFGDFDPSGEDMYHSLSKRLAELGSEPEIIKCALVPDDIDRYSLPPDFAKKTDTRCAGFVALHGDVSVEIDALPVQILRDRLTAEVSKRMDMDALNKTHTLEEQERAELVRLLANN